MTPTVLDYTPPASASTDPRRSVFVFVPAACSLALYGLAIVAADDGSASSKLGGVLIGTLLLSFPLAEIATAILTWRWWRRLHAVAKVGALLTLMIGAAWNVVIIGMNL